MIWPERIVKAFEEALDVTPISGITKSDVIYHLLDETARRAVWRAKGDPAHLSDAYTSPYTPLGAVSVEIVMSETGKAKSVTFKPEWVPAVEMLYAFVREQPQLICDEFKDQAVEYLDAI